MLVSFAIQKNFIFIIFFMIINFIVDYITNNNMKYVDGLIYYLCDTFLIVFYIIEHNLSKNKENNLEEENQTSKKGFFLLICCLIFNSIYIYKYYNRSGIIKYDTENYLIIIMFLILIEKITFKNKLYSHQILSIIIFIILFIYYLINNFIKSKINLFFYILFLLQYYSFTFKYHLIKYINMNYFINIYLLASLNGIFTVIELLIQYFNILYNEFKCINIYNIILIFIVMMFNVYLEFKIISEIGLLHRFMSDVISIFISNITVSKNFGQIDQLLIGFLIIFSGLVYLEIIQLNFCDLNINLKQNIEKRMNEELINHLNQSNIINDENENSYNDLVYIK